MQQQIQLQLLKLFSEYNPKQFNITNENIYLTEVNQQKDIQKQYEINQISNQSNQVINLRPDTFDDDSTSQNIQNGYYENSELNPNLMKNVIRQFFKFMTDEKNMEIVQEFLKQKSYQQAMKYTKKIIKDYKFNNTYLTRLINREGYRSIFEYFLTLEIQEWLYNSKIKDIQSHIKCIDFLKECCIDKKKLQALNRYKKKD
ncbi:hypothetical protein TTHERM_00143610 (macronuclear) [Tetrahymena thermophila SB210]|uniref:Uncharacterized protein n=1 Tax=Tetrahymena thermophila (strain SB210) TaxID=312017 RepID=I7LU95_TETTS|nr:hypothetical protein TTHERM_00143610 [Tetrahymena thermophila SB210]EAR90855.2 hypothetical protein TTHERM_00143610 [Tetrahymena thermophila SB210]|eukprot:XP_001011100.2 hypothetical protein TTHERM_00143610 [Tetrahymena thermophila SB210]